MKQVDVKDQVRLGLAKSFELCVSGIRYRLFRSLVTVGTVALAVAFLMTMLGQSVIARRVGSAVRQETFPRRNYVAWLGRLDKPLSDREVWEVLSGGSNGRGAAGSAEAAASDARSQADRLAELRNWGKLSAEDLATCQAIAVREKVYLDYFQHLDEGNQSLLLGPAAEKGSEIFAVLKDAGALSSFETNLKAMPGRPPGTTQELEQFIRDWNEAYPLRRRILEGQAQAVAGLAQSLPGKRTTQLLAEADEKTTVLLGQFGYVLRADDLPALRRQAEMELNIERVRRLLNLASVRSSLAERAGIAVGKVSEKTLFDQTRSEKGAANIIMVAERIDVTPEEMVSVSKARLGGEALSEEMSGAWDRMEQLLGLPGMPAAVAARAKVPEPDVTGRTMQEVCRTPEGAKAIYETARRLQAVGLTAAEMAAASDGRLRQAHLAAVEARLASEDTEGFLGFSRRTMWLILVSFAVCAVGIANAMLMSVTERFREIATMKCLGAMDGFIMLLFVLESCLQGLVGGIVGALLGVLLGVVRGWAEFGTLALGHLPGLSLLGALGISLVAGIVLAAMAAVYPAWVASRLAPMEAMRVE